MLVGDHELLRLARQILEDLHRVGGHAGPPNRTKRYTPCPPLVYHRVRSIESAPSCPGVALVSRRHPCTGGAAVYSARPVTGLPCVAAVGLQPPVQTGDALVLRGDELAGQPVRPALVHAEGQAEDGQQAESRQPRRPEQPPHGRTDSRSTTKYGIPPGSTSHISCGIRSLTRPSPSPSWNRCSIVRCEPVHRLPCRSLQAFRNDQPPPLTIWNWSGNSLSRNRISSPCSAS